MESFWQHPFNDREADASGIPSGIVLDIWYQSDVEKEMYVTPSKLAVCECARECEGGRGEGE